LAGVRVLNLGGIWAGRLAALLLADQGAEVLEIKRPQRAPRPEDALLERGKRTLELDLKSPEGQAAARELALGADIVLNNLGTGRAERFGLGHEALTSANPALVVVDMPGFARADPRASLAAWEGVIDASMGVYTDIPALGRLLGEAPVYTAIPMASAYGGVHAAVAAMFAYLHRLNTGAGQHVEVPLADAVLSAMALHAMEVENQPARYDWPAIDKVMTDVAFPILRAHHATLTAEDHARIASYLARFGRPQAANYRCADGALVFINASEHTHHCRACLQVLGVFEDLIAEGMCLASPYADSAADNNLADPANLSPHWRQRLSDVMAARFATRPAADWESALRQVGVPATVVRSTQAWLSDSALRQAGIVARVAHPDQPAGVWQAGRFNTIEGAHTRSPALRAAERCDSPGCTWASAVPTLPKPMATGGAGVLSDLRVLDLSNIIAAPTAGRVLAEFGAEVIKIDAPCPRAGPRLTVWFGLDVNQGKQPLILDLKSPAGRAAFGRLLATADVVLHNFLEPSARSLGITHEQLARLHPHVISCQLTAWGGPAPGVYQDDPAFDPVLQAASGITLRYGGNSAPAHHGSPSCIDYITGYCAAVGIAQALVALRLGRGGSQVRTSLAMSAQLIQFPYVVATATRTEASGQTATGSGPHHRLFRASDGWVFFATREADLGLAAQALKAKDASEAALAAAILQHTLAELTQGLAHLPATACVPVRRLDELRAAIVRDGDPSTPMAPGGPCMLRQDHPCGERVALPTPTWYRLAASPVRSLAPALAPGAASRSVLRANGFGEAEIDSLIAQDVVRTAWPGATRYLPR
jgi:crotonobetainyl-CoA:carnitine CoA-transferase CaiB-like acyl-CoA transferase